MDGVLVVDKPLGPTSHDVVALVRRAIRISRIGHTGTLDPLATGVLPLVIGRATRLAQFLSSSDKEYVADIMLGATSETYDAEGPLTPSTALAPVAPLEPGALEAVLDEFRGTFNQMPPPYSAKKVNGTRAYELARQNKPAGLKPVSVTVFALDVLVVEGHRLRLRVACSTGFYVRTLAHEIGARLGRGGYLAALRRTRVDGFGLEDAMPLDAVQSGGVATAASHLIPMERLLPDLPAVELAEAGARRVAHGNVVTSEHFAGGSELPAAVKSAGDRAARVRLLDASGTLLAIAELRPGTVLHPTIVLV